MYRSFLAPIIMVLVTVLAAPVLAQDSTRLFTSGAWAVDHVYFPQEGQQSCHLYSKNRDGYDLRLVAWENGDINIHIMAPDYKGAFGPGSYEVDLILDIDYKRWRLNDAFIKDAFMTFGIATGEDLYNFLSDLKAGNAIALKSPDGRTTWTAWSLRGSSRAIGAFANCYIAIKPTRNQYQGSAPAPETSSVPQGDPA